MVETQKKLIPSPFISWVNTAAYWYGITTLGPISPFKPKEDPSNFLPVQVAMDAFHLPVINALDSVFSQHDLERLFSEFKAKVFLDPNGRNIGYQSSSLSVPEAENQAKKDIHDFYLSHKSKLDSLSNDINPILQEIIFESELSAMTEQLGKSLTSDQIKGDLDDGGSDPGLFWNTVEKAQKNGVFIPDAEKRLEFVLEGGSYAPYMYLESAQAKALLNLVKQIPDFIHTISDINLIENRYRIPAGQAQYATFLERVAGHLSDINKTVEHSAHRSNQNKKYGAIVDDAFTYENIDLGRGYNVSASSEWEKFKNNLKNTSSYLIKSPLTASKLASQWKFFFKHRYHNEMGIAVLRSERRKVAVGFFPDVERTDPTTATRHSPNSERWGIMIEKWDPSSGKYKTQTDALNDLASLVKDGYESGEESEVLYALLWKSRQTGTGENAIPKAFNESLDEVFKNLNSPYARAFVAQAKSLISEKDSPYIGGPRWTEWWMTTKTYNARMARRFVGAKSWLSTPGRTHYRFGYFDLAWRKPLAYLTGGKVIDEPDQKKAEKRPYTIVFKEDGEINKGKEIGATLGGATLPLLASYFLGPVVALSISSGAFGAFSGKSTKAKLIIGAATSAVSLGLMYVAPASLLTTPLMVTASTALGTIAFGKALGAEIAPKIGKNILKIPLLPVITSAKLGVKALKNKTVARFIVAPILVLTSITGMAHLFGRNQSTSKAFNGSLKAFSGLVDTAALPARKIASLEEWAILGTTHSNDLKLSNAINLISTGNFSDPKTFLKDSRVKLEQKANDAKDEAQRQAMQRLMQEIDAKLGLPEGTTEQAKTKAEQLAALVDEVKKSLPEASNGNSNTKAQPTAVPLTPEEILEGQRIADKYLKEAEEKLNSSNKKIEEPKPTPRASPPTQKKKTLQDVMNDLDNGKYNTPAENAPKKDSNINAPRSSNTDKYKTGIQTSRDGFVAVASAKKTSLWQKFDKKSGQAKYRVVIDSNAPTAPDLDKA